MALLSFVSIIATFLLLIVAPVQGVGHLAMVALRRLRGQPARFRWMIAGPLFLIILTIVVVVVTVRFDDVILAHQPMVWQRAYVGFCFVLVFACLAVPVWYLLQVYRLTQGKFRFGSYGVALLALFAMPFTAAAINGFAAGLGALYAGREPSEKFFDLDPHRYFSQPAQSSPCSRMLSALNVEISKGDGTQLDDAVDFWVDQTLSGAFFDAAEVFGCHLSNLNVNSNDVGFSIIVVVYRLFAEVIQVTIVIWPFVPLIRRLRRA